MDDLLQRMREHVAEIADSEWPSASKELMRSAIVEIELYRKALQWYADGNHMGFAPECDWENVSGEPPNWLQNNRSEDYEMIEDGGVARKVLAGEMIDWYELDEETETTKDKVQCVDCGEYVDDLQAHCERYDNNCLIHDSVLEKISIC